MSARRTSPLGNCNLEGYSEHAHARIQLVNHGPLSLSLFLFFFLLLLLLLVLVLVLVLVVGVCVCCHLTRV